MLFVANVDEGSEEVPAAIAAHAAAQGARAVAVSSRIESELAELEDEDAAAMRAELGVSESGLERVVREAFSLLELIAFFTAGEGKPAQSWHLRDGLTAWHAAGEIHSDIQKGFVRAEVIGWQRAGRRGRLRGRPRARHAAPRGPRLRDARRRRDHRQVHALGAPSRASFREALGEAAHARARPRCRAPRAKSVRRSAGRSTSIALQRGDLLERAQQLGVLAQRRRRCAGASPRAEPSAPAARRRQRRARASSEPCSRSSSAAVFAPTPGRARDPVGGVAAQGDQVGDQLGADAVALAHLLGPDLADSAALAELDHRHPLADGAVEVAVAGQQQRAPAALAPRRARRRT